MQTNSPAGTLVGRRVLVVEDEYFLAQDISRALRKLGAEIVGPLASLAEALSVLSAEAKIDLAVLDVNLRGDAVYPLADALRERGVPFVLATGYDPKSIPECYRMVPHWEKPFETSDLVATLPALTRHP